MKKLITMISIAIMAMIATSLTVSASAMPKENDVYDTGNEMKFKTVLNLGDAVTSPIENFEYTIARKEISGGAIWAVTEALPTVDTAEFTVASTVDTNATIFENTVTFDITDFKAPGTYLYTLTATENTSIGIDMDLDATRTIGVSVIQNAGTLEIAQVWMYTGDVVDESAKTDNFTNGYGVAGGGDGNTLDPQDEPYTFTVSNAVAGNMADRNLDFNFTLSGADIDANTIFDATIAGVGIKIKWNGSAFVNLDDSALIVAFANAESIVIKNVFNSMSFTVTATDDNTNYWVYSSNNTTAPTVPASPTDPTNTQVTQTKVMGSANDGVSFVHYYESIIPETGVLLDFLPYILIILVAGFILYRRMTEESRENAKK